MIHKLNEPARSRINLYITTPQHPAKLDSLVPIAKLPSRSGVQKAASIHSSHLGANKSISNATSVIRRFQIQMSLVYQTSLLRVKVKFSCLGYCSNAMN